METLHQESISKLIHSKRVIVCCGSGGVGKTTTSATLALLAAKLGKRSIVITIDPAKRLATSLGLNALEPVALDLTRNVNQILEEKKEPPLKGKFSAIIPHTAKTFEELFYSLAGKNSQLANRIFQTSIYKIFTQEFSGTNEYMAMEKLYSIYQSQEYDIVILDTPPSPNTKLFLEAPRLFENFFDEHIMKWLLNPPSKAIATGVKKSLEVLERLTGKGFISQLIDFSSALFEMRKQFIENLQAIDTLLRGDGVAFLMVTSPARLSRQDALEFVHLIKENGYHFEGFIVNRVLSLNLGKNLDKIDFDTLNREEKKIAEICLKRLNPILEMERNTSQYLRQFKDAFVYHVPEQKTDVHSISALLELSKVFDMKN